MPKLRRGNGDLNWQSINRYERCWGPLLDQQVMGYWSDGEPGPAIELEGIDFTTVDWDFVLKAMHAAL